MHSAIAFALALLSALSEQSLLTRVQRQCPCADLVMNPCFCQAGITPRCTCITTAPSSSCACSARAQNSLCLASCQDICIHTCSLKNKYPTCPSSCRHVCTQACIPQHVSAALLTPYCPQLCKQSCQRTCANQFTSAACIPLCEQSCRQRCAAAMPGITEKQTMIQSESAAPVQGLSPSECTSSCIPPCTQCIQDQLIYQIPGAAHQCPNACMPICEWQCILEHEAQVIQEGEALRLLPQPEQLNCIAPCMPSCTPQCIEEQELLTNQVSLPIYLQPGIGPRCVTPCRPTCTPQCVREQQLLDDKQILENLPTTSPQTQPQCIPQCMPACASECILEQTQLPEAKELTESSASAPVGLQNTTPCAPQCSDRQELATSDPFSIDTNSPPPCFDACMPDCEAQCILNQQQILEQSVSEEQLISAESSTSAIEYSSSSGTSEQPQLEVQYSTMSTSTPAPSEPLCEVGCQPTCTQCSQQPQGFSIPPLQVEIIMEDVTEQPLETNNCVPACSEQCAEQCVGRENEEQCRKICQEICEETCSLQA